LTRLAAGAHVTFVVAFFLPWVAGAFGRHGSVPGQGLARMALDRAPVMLSTHGLVALVLISAPALAAAAAAVLLGRRWIGLDERGAHALALVAGSVPLVTAVAAGTGVLAGWWDERISEVAPGLLLAVGAACVAALASALVLRSSRSDERGG
jgi:peptidoglycan biosynthesis protein MviN/MurJ (putative lipid II flippase)